MPERTPFPQNVPGDWYVEDGCCITCAVPMVVAPDLFSWAIGPDGHEVLHCFVSRQPRGEPELDRMLGAAREADAGCIRYRGFDARVRARLRACNAEHAIDGPDDSAAR